MRKIIAITGQTATGKTNLALHLKQQYDGELINYDSRQIYKHLNIITGKDTVDIYLYDIADPKEYFSSFNYVSYALPVIKHILAQNKTPILVGGTYLYLKHLLYGIGTEHKKPDWALREKLQNESKEELQHTLKSIDPKQYSLLNNSDLNNPRRLVRKIEIALQTTDTGVDKKSTTLSQRLRVTNLHIKLIGLRFESKDELIEAIQKRVRSRIKQGAVAEVKNLLFMGYTKKDPGLQTIGYQQIIRYLEGNISLEEATNEWVIKEIQYAKRQYTFMKKDKRIEWKFV